MHPTNKAARVAAVRCLVMGPPVVFPLVYVLHNLIVPGNAAATANHVLAHEMLFRFGIVFELFNAVGFIFVVRALHRLLNGVGRGAWVADGHLIAGLRSVSFPNVLNDIVALALFGADFLAAAAGGMLCLRWHGQRINLAAVFCGLWLFPFGILVMRSGFLARVLGIADC